MSEEDDRIEKARVRAAIDNLRAEHREHEQLVNEATETRYDEAYEYAQEIGATVTLGKTRTPKWFTPTAFAGFVVGHDWTVSFDPEIHGQPTLAQLWSNFQELFNG